MQKRGGSTPSLGSLAALSLAMLLGCAGKSPDAVATGPASPASSPVAVATGPAAPASSPVAKEAAAPARPSRTAARKPYPERWYSAAVFYEVMVRSFQDSNGDGIGDLKGLISRLDYLNTGDPASTTDLKVDALWLMPLFKSPSYHGYDATDYYQIDPAYGTMDDFRTLVAEAHKRGIRILLDLVLNHTSNQHPWFQKAGKGPDAPERDWYIWRKDDPGWVRPWGGGPVWHQRGEWYYYGLFWEGMPDLNFRHPPVQEEMLKIAKFWVEQGADGYRLDAIRYLFEAGKGQQADLPETHAYLQRMAAELQGVNPDVAMVGEAWTDTKDVVGYFGKGNELDLSFGFDEAGGILESVRTGEPGPLRDALVKVADAYPERHFSAPFLTNHDMPRLASILERDPEKMRLAFSVLMSLPGAPFLYQGEEIGLFNGSRPGDEGKRTPMQWDGSSQAGFTTGAPWNPLSGEQAKVSVGAQEKDPESLLSWYKARLRDHRASKALKVGMISRPAVGEGAYASILSFQRAVEGEIVAAVFNFSGKAVPGHRLALDVDAIKAEGGAKGRWRLETLGTKKPVPAAKLAGLGEGVDLPAFPGESAVWIRLVRED